MDYLISIAIIAIVICFIIISLLLLHKFNRKRFLSCDKSMTYDAVDDILLSRIKNIPDNSFTYTYYYQYLPLGRVNAFLNYFGRNIYNDEPYVYYCKRSSRDNEFREYGCAITRSGVYISIENPGNRNLKDKDNTILESYDRNISFSGLANVFGIGSYIITVNYVTDKFFDSFRVYNVSSSIVRNQIKDVCKSVISHDIGFCIQRDMFDNLIDNEGWNITKDYINKTDNSIIRNKSIFSETERKLDYKSEKVGIIAAGVQAEKPQMAAFFGETKNLMNGSRGNGYAAEYANNTMDRVLGRDVENAAQQLEHGRQIKGGADRLVNNVEIQTKYYKTASETIGAAFECKQAIYIRTDGSEKMMQIEVPRDQYKQALIEMQKRIDNGQVPNVSPGEDAKNYVRKGYFTYEQSYNIAHACTIESLAVDIASGAVCCAAAAGITSVMIFAIAVWRGASPKEAAKQCLSTSLSIMGKGTLIYTLTMQLSRKEVAIALAGKVFTKDGIPQGYKSVANPIYKASENLASKIAGTKMAKSSFGQSLGLESINSCQVVGGAVAAAVIFGPDIVRTMQGKISTKQLFKNSTIAAAGMAGAAAAQAAIPIPVVPAIVGGAVAGIAAKKTLDHFIEDDAKEMFRILKEEFIDTTMLIGLTPKEFDEISSLTVRNKKISKILQNMFQSENRRQYARVEIMQVAIHEVTKKRKRISKQEYEHGLIELLMDEEVPCAN